MMLARFSLKLRFDAGRKQFEYESENLRPAERRLEFDGRELIILGHPFVDGRRSDAAVLKELRTATDIKDFARRLDGGFLVLVHERAAARLHVITDRFASFAFYYRDGSTTLEGALTPLALAEPGVTKLDENALFEFIWLRRLLGEKTFDTSVRYLASASVLTVDTGGIVLAKYWNPDYAASRFDENGGARAIADALRNAMAAQTEDNGGRRRYALFLSGGLDSRALLAAAAEPIDAVTSCMAFNNEAEVAQRVAEAAHAAFRFVPRPAAPYDGFVEDAVWLNGGQQIFTEAQFIGYSPLLAGWTDCFFIGLGLDIFFGGLYLPKRPVDWFGRQALHYELLPLSKDLAGDYLAGVKYRLSTSDPLSFVKPSHRALLRDGLRDSVEAILAQGRVLGANGYDLWEYLHLHNLSRHYSFPMIQSVRTWAECRAPALTNAMFDIAIRLPAEHKANSDAYLRALRSLAPELMAIRNANTNLPAGLPFRQQSLLKAVRTVANRMLGTSYRMSPAATERSWPQPANVLRASSALQTMVRALPQSQALAAVPFIDMDSIARVVADHDAGRHDHTVGLFVLLTAEQALMHMA